MLISVIPALLCITFHELCHGAVAYKLGDNTAKNAGRLTLNPIKHIDIMGLLMMVVFKFGWAKPVPVNMNNFKNPKRDMAITALAGPVSNVILAAFVLLIYGFLYVPLLKAGSFGDVVLQMI
ncbi:MAG: site-2 protease family protein, partial [Oscillospiraceae bacterium]